MDLFKRAKAPKPEPPLQQLPISAIAPNPQQPRTLFTPQALETLSASIAQVGILQPLTVRKVKNGWELIAGERRLRASQMAGLTHVPCIVMEVTQVDSSILALVENLQRQNLDYIEEAHAMANLIAQFGLSQEELSKQLGKSQSAVANMLRLLRLSDKVVEKLRQAQCTQRHARALLKLQEEGMQLEVLEKVEKQGLNVSQTEELIERYLSPPLPQSGKRKVILRDVRLFLNSVTKGLELMRCAGVEAECDQEDSEEEILLTIRIPRNKKVLAGK